MMIPTILGIPRKYNQVTAGLITVPMMMATKKMKITWLK
jgi:hypothetical protein